MVALPMDSLIPQIVSALGTSPALVIEAPPGAGKTTRVPPALMQAFGGDILVLEPRRIAARMAARRVASELGESVGERVGYQVRFERAAGPRTRLLFITEGVLVRRLLADPHLRGVGAVILDEFHERRLDTDLALALLHRLQRSTRPELRMAVMSATLDAAPVAGFLNAPVVRSEGRLHDLAVEFAAYSSAPLEQQVAEAVGRAIGAQPSGDVLVFLPGAAEIRRSMQACERLARTHGLMLVPLHGDLTPAEQDRAVTPADRRKVIFSTNVAESSVTVEGVNTVIDTGLARMASDSPWTGLPQLNVARISKASATQRAGRAGRTGPGRVYRLYTAEDFARRPDHDAPEIARRELSQLCLDLHGVGVGAVAELAWLEQPPAEAVCAAESLLRQLGAVDARSRATPLGIRMARLPLHPRLARLAMEGADRGAGDGACRAAALLSMGTRAEHMDILHAIDSSRDPAMERAYRQIRRIAGGRGAEQGSDIGLLQSILTAFPDRVARRRAGGQALLANGGSAVLAGEIAAEFFVALDIEERAERGLPMIRLIARIEPEWLIDLLPERVRERNAVEWNRGAERVERVSALLYDELAIEETRDGAVDPDEGARVLGDKAVEAGIGRFVDREQLDGVLARIAFAAEHSGVQPMGPAEVERALREICYGLRSFAELERAGTRVVARLEDAAGKKLLDEIAPERIRLPGGRAVRLHYSANQSPWIESRLQDFFGVHESPRIAHGRVPVVVRLLAPNGRPVQTTTDLAGFWERLYPHVRRELSRRYPRHAWPEKP